MLLIRMPRCVNDSKRHYAGTEPSPKGRGYCAHAEKLSQRRKGKNGKLWEVPGGLMGSSFGNR